MNHYKKLKLVSMMLKKRFPQLTVEQTLDFTMDLLGAIDEFDKAEAAGTPLPEAPKSTAPVGQSPA